jgi:molybdenum cofactor synthesis domain-containing protein
VGRSEVRVELCQVITVSDRSAVGAREDLSGPVLVDALQAAGYEPSLRVISDGEADVSAALRDALAQGSRLIVTTGGTGVGPRDRTPEGTSRVIDRELPGVAELLRADGRLHSAHAALSRGVVGVVDASASSPGALIVNLPGSAKAVREGIAVILPLVAHVLDQLAGGDH